MTSAINLRVISVEVRIQTMFTNQLKQISRIEEEEDRSKDLTLRNSADEHGRSR
jgi:hypothetical protein